MNAYDLVATIHRMGVTFFNPLPGQIRLSTSAEHLPRKAVDLAKQHKAELLKILDRSRDLPPCKKCGSPILAVPTFDRFENFECLKCGQCFGCRRIQDTTTKSNAPTKQRQTSRERKGSI